MRSSEIIAAENSLSLPDLACGYKQHLRLMTEIDKTKNFRSKMVQALLPSEPVKTKICKSGLKVDRNSHENMPEKTKEHY